MKDLLRNLDLSYRVGKLPFPVVLVLVVGAVMPLAVAAVIVNARVTKSSNTRIHLWQDMDQQPRFDAQQATPVFADGRGMRPRVVGTVARGQLRNDDQMYRGFELNGDGEAVMIGEGDEAVESYFSGYPQGVKVDAKLLARGEMQYNVYCFTCHGRAGQGNGPTHQRAQQLVDYDSNSPANATGTSWVQPSNLTLPMYYEANYPNGHLFSTISQGKGNMKGYASQIDPVDRWAIVTYVRALQLAQDADQELE